MKTLLTTLSLILLMATAVEGQIVDRTKDKAKNKTNNRIDQRIDRGIDKGLDKIEGVFKKRGDKTKAPEGMSEEEQKAYEAGQNNGGGFGMFNMGSKADVADTYEFQHQVDMIIESYDKKGKEEDPIDYKMLFIEDAPHFGVIMKAQDYQSRMIYDMGNSQVISLMDSEEMNIGMVMSLDPEVVANYAAESDEEQMSIEKTGRTKSILGYTAYEYVMEDEDNNYEYWVAEDLGIDLSDSFGTMMASDKKSKMNASEYPQGMMMEMTSVDKGNGRKTIMRVTAINKNSPSKISTVGYTFMGG